MNQASRILDAPDAFQTSVFCIISNRRVLLSKSPAIFTTVFGRTGINAAYVPFMVEDDDIGKAMESLRVLNISGANIMAPYKEKVLPYLDVLSEGANIIGAVNTIVCKEGGLKGYNTNAIGIMDALNAVNFDIPGKKALVIGTGGVARAVVFILNWLRAESIIVAGRDNEKTGRLANQFSVASWRLNDLANYPVNVDLIVNATSISSRDDSSELTDIVGSMKNNGCRLVFDLNYGRRDNIWQSLAEKNNTRFMDGLSSLAYQARRTFLLWTGREVPQEEFIKAMAG